MQLSAATALNRRPLPLTKRSERVLQSVSGEKNTDGCSVDLWHRINIESDVETRLTSPGRWKAKLGRGHGMAFNNPSSRTPVSYAGATKALGYLARAAASAFSRDDDDMQGGEDASLLRKKKGAAQENRWLPPHEHHFPRPAVLNSESRARHECTGHRSSWPTHGQRAIRCTENLLRVRPRASGTQLQGYWLDRVHVVKRG